MPWARDCGDSRGRPKSANDVKKSIVSFESNLKIRKIAVYRFLISLLVPTNTYDITQVDLNINWKRTHLTTCKSIFHLLPIKISYIYEF